MMIRFRMVKINVEQFAIIASGKAIDSLTLNTTLGFKYSTEGRRVACTLDLKFSDSEELAMLLNLNCEFAINNEDWDNQIAAGESIDIPVKLREFLATQTIGTARGILHCKTEGTPYSGVILPPINVVKMMEE